ncbi:Threonine/homoserine/homoserine lactone efflux protein [Palleronia salina]|uniref:Threonine/homoserine/homoserine lactone efflux protein n=1 Tax=Palleronia salina TaxID=313368 RepID=A0A1M6FZW8_9RHOB|nr:LysE family translocator [Palleronia salina]SHJ03210.1 Threonine/homoserine/homoserine lactone efflux protein [Palleronia salina]
MAPDTFLALLTFAIVATVTPGPNNVMVMASGANFGLRRTLPHMLGITFGFGAMIALVGVGVMRVFDAWPPSYTVMQVLCAAYLLYLAYRIATAPAPGAAGPRARPFTALQAAAFQWINPKAWAMGLAAVTLYAPTRAAESVLIVAGTFMLVAMPCIAIWVLAGQGLARALTSPFRRRLFNGLMAGGLILSLAPALI